MTLAESESCINCKEILNCGTVNKMLLDYSKSELLKRITSSNKKPCPNFNFTSICDEVLKRKLDHLVEISKKKKDELKHSKNRV